MYYNNEYRCARLLGLCHNQEKPKTKSGTLLTLGVTCLGTFCRVYITGYVCDRSRPIANDTQAVEYLIYLKVRC